MILLPPASEGCMGKCFQSCLSICPQGVGGHYPTMHWDQAPPPLHHGNRVLPLTHSTIASWDRTLAPSLTLDHGTVPPPPSPSASWIGTGRTAEALIIHPCTAVMRITFLRSGAKTVIRKYKDDRVSSFE